MPFDEPLALPPIARVEPSAVIELSWLVIARHKRNALHLISDDLEAEAEYRRAFTKAVRRRFPTLADIFEAETDTGT